MNRRKGVFVLAALALAAGFIPWPMPAHTVLKSLGAELPAASGIVLSARKSARLTLLPVPTITVRDPVFMHESGEQLAKASHIALRMRFLPLMAGTVQVSHAIVYGASAHVTAAARKSWLSALSGIQKQAFRPQLTLVDSRIVLEKADDSIRNINASLEWQGARGVLNIWGHGIWRGETVRLQASGVPLNHGLQEPIEQPAQIQVHTPYVIVDAHGSIGNGRAIGALHMTMNNATRLAQWLGQSVPMAGLLDQFSLAGSGTLSERGVQLGEATLVFGPNTLKGTLSLTQQGKQNPLISGTLATTSLEMNAMASAFDAVQEPSGQWSGDQFDTRSLQTADFDIRVSATHARIMKMALTDAALSATLKNGRLDLALGRSSAYGGTLRSRVTIARMSDTQTEQKIQTSFDSIDFGKFSDDMFQMRLLSGTVSGQFQAESTGSSPHAILNGLNGRGNFTITQGELTGISLAETIRHAERGQTQLASLQSGSTRFDTGAFTLSVQGGLVHFQDGRINSAGAQATLGGQINLHKKEYNLNGAVLHPLRSKQWPFEISGPWSKPSARMISQAPTQRSEPTYSRSDVWARDSRS